MSRTKFSYDWPEDKYDIPFFVFPGSYSYRSFPNGITTKAGSYIVGYRDSPSHGLNGTVILHISRSTDSGRTWTEVAALNKANTDYRNQNFLLRNDGRIYMYFGEYDSTIDEFLQHMRYVYSDDDGQTWSDIAVINIPDEFEEALVYDVSGGTGNFLYDDVEGDYIGTFFKTGPPSVPNQYSYLVATPDGINFTVISRLTLSETTLTIRYVGLERYYMAFSRAVGGSALVIKYSQSRDGLEAAVAVPSTVYSSISPFENSSGFIAPTVYNNATNGYIVAGSRGTNDRGMYMIQCPESAIANNYIESQIRRITVSRATSTDAGYTIILDNGNGPVMITYDSNPVRVYCMGFYML